MYCLFSKKGYSLLSRYKTIPDKERGIEIFPEGTHGTATWMDKKRAKEVLEVGSLDQVTAPLFRKLPSGEYVGLKIFRELIRILSSTVLQVPENHEAS